jgi:hypothetical protein
LETTLSVLPWAERPAVKKGELGESIVDDFLRGKRVIPYRPHYDGAHPFDRLCATADKRNVFIRDDGRRISYPLRGQGIIYFPLDNMQHVAEIDSEQAQKLKDLSSRNEKYVYE